MEVSGRESRSCGPWCRQTPSESRVTPDTLYPDPPQRAGVRPPLVAILAAAVVLAGCSGVPFVGGSDEQVPAATPIPQDQVDDPSPPGVSSGRVLSPTALGRAHARAIENESYVLTAERTVRYANGTLHSRLALDLAIEADRTFLVHVSTAGPGAPVFLGRPPAEAAYWSDGTTYLRRLTRDGETTYNAFGPPSTWVGTWSYWANSVPFGGRDNRPSTFYASLFTAVPTEVTGRTTVEDTPVLRIEDRDGRAFSEASFPGGIESVRDLSMVALVDDDGLVRSLDLRYAGNVDGEPVRVHRTVRYESVGSTSVERPSWYDRATNASGGGTAASNQSNGTDDGG